MCTDCVLGELHLSAGAVENFPGSGYGFSGAVNAGWASGAFYDVPLVEVEDVPGGRFGGVGFGVLDKNK